MGTKYDQLSVTERGAVARLRAEGRSIRQIAAALDRSASTIARELRRFASRRKQLVLSVMPAKAGIHEHSRRLI